MSNSLRPSSARKPASRSVAADGLVVTLRCDSLDIAPAHANDSARIFAEASALSALSQVWCGGLSCNPSIKFDAQQQPFLTATLPHSSPTWSLLSSVREYRQVCAFGSVVATLLHHWHALGVVHRSLSPSSVLVDLQQAAAPDESSVVLLSWGGSAVYNWSKACYICRNPLPHPSISHAAPERLSFSLEMFTPLAPAEDWFSFGRILALAAPRTPADDAAFRATGFASQMMDPALSVLVSAPAADASPALMSALLELDPPARRLNGQAISVGVKGVAEGGSTLYESNSLYCPTGVAWLIPGVELRHDGLLPITEVLCFKTHLSMKSLDFFDSSSFLILGCSIVQSLFVMWNAAAQAGKKRDSGCRLDLESPSFFFVPERQAGLNLHKSIMAALDNREMSYDPARASAFASAVRLSANLQIDRESVVAKLGDLYRQESQVITVLVPIYYSELAELVEMNSLLLKNNTCAVFVALVDAESSLPSDEMICRTLQVVDLTTPLAKCSYVRDAVSHTLNLPEPLLSKVVAIFEEKTGSSLGSVVSEFLLWTEQLVKAEIVKYVAHSGMVHSDLSAISSAPVSFRVATFITQRIVQPGVPHAAEMLRLCSAASATCGDTCFYELPVELALAVADVSRSTLEAAVALGLCVTRNSEDFDDELLVLTHEHLTNLPFEESQVNTHIRFVRILHSELNLMMQTASRASFLTRPFRPGLVNYAASLVPVFSNMGRDEKRQLKRKIMALSEHMFALSSVGHTSSDVADSSSISSRLPSHSDLARLLLLGVQLSNSSHEYNKARTFASAGVSLLSSLDKSVTNEAAVSLLHFQMHCDTLASFTNQNVAQGIDSEKLLLKQYSEGGSSRWCSGVIFSALLELSQSVNFMQRCSYHDAFNLGRSAFVTLDVKRDKDSESKRNSALALSDLASILSKCLSHKFWTEESDSVSLHQTQTDVFLFDTFERLVLPSLSCGIEAVLNLLFIHTTLCFGDSEKVHQLSLTIVPILHMSMATSRTSSGTPTSSELLEFVAERLKDTVPGLQSLQACLWTALSILPFSSPKSINAFVEAYSSTVRSVDVLSEMTSKPFKHPYNGSTLLGSSHMLDCIASDFSDANEGDLSCAARFFSAALAFIGGCDISHLSDALAYICSSNSLSLFGERLVGSLLSVVPSPILGQACCRKDAELLPDTFYSVVLSIEALWNVILGDWDATLSTTKRASVLKVGPGLPLFQMNLNFCSCLARLHRLLAARDDAKTHLLAEAVNDLESIYICIAPEKFGQQFQSSRAPNDSVAKTSRLMSSLLADSSALMEFPGGGLLQIVCALFSEFLGVSPKLSSDCYENAYNLCVRDGLHLHSALACHFGHAFLARNALARQRSVPQDTRQFGSGSEATLLAPQDGDGNQLMLDMRALRQLERSHALFSAMRFDIRVLMAQRAQPSLASAVYPDCPLSKSSAYVGHVWFGGFIMHDRLLRMQGCLGVQSQSSLFGPKMPNASFSSKFTALMENAGRIQSDLYKIEAPVPSKSPVPALLHAAQIIGRMIGAQRGIVISKTTTSVSVSATIDALADVTFCPFKGVFGEDVVALCSQPPVSNPEIPEWLLKYGFTNKGVHIFQNVSTSFGSNLLSEQEVGEGPQSFRRTDASPKLTRKSSFVSLLPSRTRSSSSASHLPSASSRRSSMASAAQKPTTLDTGLSSVVLLSWGKMPSGNGEPHVSYLLWFEHRGILGIFGPDFYLNTLRTIPDSFHPSAHPLAFLLVNCLPPLEALVGTGLSVARTESLSFTKKDIDEDTQVTQIADRQPIVGILWKRGSLFKSWKERHFQLFNTTFKYYHKDDKINSLNSFEITHDTALLEVAAADRKEISAPFEHCFCLMSENRQLYLCADQNARMKKWMKVLAATVEHARKMTHRNTESFAFNACVAPPPLNSMTIVRRLGVGGFGEVFLASWNGLFVAVKKMTKELTATSLFRFRREADMMSIMRHPNILTYMACSLNPPNLMIVMEYMSNGSLLNVLQV